MSTDPGRKSRYRKGRGQNQSCGIELSAAHLQQSSGFEILRPHGRAALIFWDVWTERMDISDEIQYGLFVQRLTPRRHVR